MQSPFKVPYKVTQGYSTAHMALDMVPLDENGNAFPADLYPILDGTEVSFQNDSNTRGKGIRMQGTLPDDVVAKLKEQGVIFKSYTGKVTMNYLYWHCLEVTDIDGVVDMDTRVAVCGNTGKVYHNGVLVPDDQKGVPPYSGLHLHLEIALFGDRGQLVIVPPWIDPTFILNLITMDKLDIRQVLSKDGRTVWLAVGCPTEAVLEALKTILGAYGNQLPSQIDSKDL